MAESPRISSSPNVIDHRQASVSAVISPNKRPPLAEISAQQAAINAAAKAQLGHPPLERTSTAIFKGIPQAAPGEPVPGEPEVKADKTKAITIPPGQNPFDEKKREKGAFLKNVVEEIDKMMAEGGLDEIAAKIAKKCKGALRESKIDLPELNNVVAFFKRHLIGLIIISKNSRTENINSLTECLTPRAFAETQKQIGRQQEKEMLKACFFAHAFITSLQIRIEVLAEALKQIRNAPTDAKKVYDAQVKKDEVKLCFAKAIDFSDEIGVEQTPKMIELQAQIQKLETEMVEHLEKK